MPSQTDLDQGGTARAWTRAYLGPSVGWVDAPSGNVLSITAAGTYPLDPSTTVVTVNVAGAVTIILPSAINPGVPAGAQPGLFIDSPIVIVDIGGNAAANPITIKPKTISETIMGLAQIQITANYGGFTLAPNSTSRTWNSISP